MSQLRLYNCPDCGDVMPAKYERSHPVLCRVIRILMADQVDRLVDEIWWST